MPLVGGGGSPNVAGSNPSGTGSSLNYIGNHAYATSGSIALTNGQSSAADTLLDFTTGNSYMIGKLDVSNTAVSTENMFVQLIFDGEVVIDNSEAHPAPAEPLRFDILIPAYSHVQLKVGTGGSSIKASAFITGEVYA